MGVITKEVEVVWSSKNKRHYEEMGYKYNGMRNKFMCKVEDLIKKSNSVINFTCDVCGDSFSQCYGNRMSLKEDIINNNDILCIKCLRKRLDETRKKIPDSEKYNIEKLHTNQQMSLMDISNLYGVKYGTVELFFRRHGIKVLSNVDLIDEGLVLELYSKGMPLRTLAKKMKTRDENIKNILNKNNIHIRSYTEQTQTSNWQSKNRSFYVDYDTLYDLYITKELSSLEIGEMYECNHQSVLKLLGKYKIPKRDSNEMFKTNRIQTKCRLAMSKNGNTPCSNQQRYLHNLYGGELNYPVGISTLDIAFPDSKMYVEYDGGGHDLGVKLGHISKENFEKREIRRNIFFKNRGWVCMRIISTNDKLPCEDILKEMFEIAKEWLKDNHSFITFDVDNQIVITSKYKKEFNYGYTSRLKEKY